MPEGLLTVSENPIAIADVPGSQRPSRVVPICHQPPSDALARVESEIRSLEQELAFIGALCRSYEQMSSVDGS